MKGAMKEDKLVTGYSDLALRPPGPEMMKGSRHCIATFQLHTDVSQLFPYINAAAEDAVYYEEPPFIKFSLHRFQCALHPDSGAASPFEREGEAHVFMDRLIVFLNDLHLRRDSIGPSYKMYRPVSVLDVFRLLPRTNCRECGFPTCMAFAAAVSKQETVPARCPGFSRPIAANAVYPVYDREGNLLSTVTLAIETEEPDQELLGKRAYVEGLKTRLAESRRARGADVEEANNALPAPLTGRELEVLRLVAQGATNAEIADLLEISPHTVKSHVIHIFNKLGVSDRTQAAVWAARNNLI
jgi:DNA-binding CsgD family transcriptional regulator/ArsR family metal-binding transcriptional regulator